MTGSRTPRGEGSTAPLVQYENHEGVVYLTLNRPEKLNAVNTDLILALREALVRFDRDDSAAVAILHGAGRAFSSGADLAAAQQNESAVSGMWSDSIRPRDLFDGYVHWKPIIAAVHGYVLGAGLGMALRSDAIIAASSTQFQISEIPRDLPAGGLWALLHFRGAGTFADEVALTGRFFTGEEAAQRGIVTKVTADGGHLTAADDFARKIQTMPARSVRLVVRARRWYMRDAERQAGFLAEPRPVLGAPKSDDPDVPFDKLMPPPSA